MTRSRIAAFSAGALLLLSGCGSLGSLYSYQSYGMLYTHTVKPLSRHREPVNVAPSGSASGNMKEIHFQYVSILWDENAIGEIAKKGGIGQIHFVDLETRRYLFGIWTRHTVHVYGTAQPSPQLLPPNVAGAGTEPGGAP